MLRLSSPLPSYHVYIGPRAYCDSAYLITFPFRHLCVQPARLIPDFTFYLSHAHSCHYPRSISITRESALHRSYSSLRIIHRIGNAHLRAYFCDYSPLTELAASASSLSHPLSHLRLSDLLTYQYLSDC